MFTLAHNANILCEFVWFCLIRRAFNASSLKPNQRTLTNDETHKWAHFTAFDRIKALQRAVKMLFLDISELNFEKSHTHPTLMLNRKHASCKRTFKWFKLYLLNKNIFVLIRMALHVWLLNRTLKSVDSQAHFSMVWFHNQGFRIEGKSIVYSCMCNANDQRLFDF